jgi:hypothetical protein
MKSGFLLRWEYALKEKNFKAYFIFGLLLLAIILLLFPYFFNYIEHREGKDLNDSVLNFLPAFNLSIPVFVIIWITTISALILFFREPKLLLIFLWSYIFLCLTRIITMSIVPLNPPRQLIPLIDPIISIFYGTGFITKDLFYSGHTSTQFLFFLCLYRKPFRWLYLISTIVIAIAVLIQHVHYTMDVAVAPLFAFGCHKMAKKLLYSIS